MSIDWFRFILLGFALSVPIGAITIEMIKRGVRSGFLHAWMVGVGGMSADVMLMLLIYYGASDLLSGFFAQTLVWLLGFGVLLYLGIESIVAAFRTIQWDTESRARGGSVAAAYVSGFAIAASNPLNLVFWISIYGSVLASSLQSANTGEILLSSSAIFVGIAIWDVVVAAAAHAGKQVAGQRFMRWFSLVAGIALIGFGLSFGFRACQNLAALFN